LTIRLAIGTLATALLANGAGANEQWRSTAPVVADAMGDESVRSDLVVRALTLLDTPYRFGGASPGGFDCSGLVQYVYSSVAGYALPRRSEDMGKAGEPILPSQLQPGDLVFFNTLSRGFSHVAIYIGEGRFVHAPTRGGRVRIEALDDRYWRSRFDGARRLLAAGGGAATAPRAARVTLSSEPEIIRP